MTTNADKSVIEAVRNFILKAQDFEFCSLGLYADAAKALAALDEIESAPPLAQCFKSQGGRMHTEIIRTPLEEAECRAYIYSLDAAPLDERDTLRVDMQFNDHHLTRTAHIRELESGEIDVVAKRAGLMWQALQEAINSKKDVP